MGRKYFGTDGVRGRVGQSPITPDFVMRLGYAAGSALVARDASVQERPAVLIGKDTRISGYMLEAALEAGFSAAGVDVMLCGPMPTPAVAYLTRALRLQAGVVISASHNRYDDNGIKFFSAQGTKLPDAVELDIEARLEQPMICMESARLGKARRVDDAAGRYIEFCKSTFPNDLDLRGLKIVVDSAHGAAYHVAPSVFHELGRGNSRRRRRAERPQHQPRRRRHRARGPAPCRAGAPRPTAVLRSTATATGWSWSTRPARSTMATNCST
jgi:phosphoglucosamine mutase